MATDINDKLKELQALDLQQKIQKNAVQERAIELQTQNSTKTANATADQVSSNIAKNRVEIAMTFIKPIFSAIWKVVVTLLRDLSPYIALILVIYFLIVISRGGRRSSSQQNQRDDDKEDGWWESIKKKTAGFFEPSYQLRSFFSSLRFGKKDLPFIERRKLRSGRCDNIKWMETGGEGQDGLCIRTYKPKPIRWVLDTDRMPELEKMPEQIVMDLKSGGDHLTVYIPWEQQGTFYVPQCDKAYYLKIDDNGKERKVSASRLLVENGLTCKRAELPSKMFAGVRYRPKGMKNKVTFASVDDPMC
jgi:hypothetical protein